MVLSKHSITFLRKDGRNDGGGYSINKCLCTILALLYDCCSDLLFELLAYCPRLAFITCPFFPMISRLLLLFLPI